MIEADSQAEDSTAGRKCLPMPLALMGVTEWEGREVELCLCSQHGCWDASNAERQAGKERSPGLSSPGDELGGMYAQRCVHDDRIGELVRDRLIVDIQMPAPLFARIEGGHCFPFAEEFAISRSCEYGMAQSAQDDRGTRLSVC